MSSQPDEKIEKMPSLENHQLYQIAAGGSPIRHSSEMDEVEVFLREEKLPEIVQKTILRPLGKRDKLDRYLFQSV